MAHMIGRWVAAMAAAGLLVSQANAAGKIYVCKEVARTGLEQAADGAWTTARLRPQTLTVSFHNEFAASIGTSEVVCDFRMGNEMRCLGLDNELFLLDQSSLEFSFSRNLAPHRLSKVLEPLIPYTLDLGTGTCKEMGK